MLVPSTDPKLTLIMLEFVNAAKRLSLLGTRGPGKASIVF